MAKVLLVEDENNLREIYEARLQAEGYEIAAAQDGEQALVVAKQFKPDLIISDVMMPKISGFEMLDILRNTEGLEHTRVIMLTALGQAEDKTRADSLGADRYLVKSQVTLEDIVKSAHEIIDNDNGNESLPAALAGTETHVAEPTTPTFVGVATAPGEPAPATPAAAPTVVEAAAAPQMAVATPPVMPVTEPVQPAPPTAVSIPVVDGSAAPTPTATPAPAAATEPTASTQPAFSADTGASTGAPTAPTATPNLDAVGTPPATPEATTPQTPPITTEPVTEPTQPAEAFQSNVATPEATAPSAEEQPASTEAPAQTEAAVAGTAASEQQVINKQIEDFISSTEFTTAQPAVAAGTTIAPTPNDSSTSAEPAAPEPSAASVDDQLLADAADSLAGKEPSTDTPPASDPSSPTVITPQNRPILNPETDKAEQTEDAAPAAPAPAGSVPIANKKVITPPESSEQPSLNELLAREEAKDAGLPPAPVAVSTAAYEDVPLPGQSAMEAPASTDPSADTLDQLPGLSIEPQPAPETPQAEESPKKPTDFDPNHIAL